MAPAMAFLSLPMAKNNKTISKNSSVGYGLAQKQIDEPKN